MKRPNEEIAAPIPSVPADIQHNYELGKCAGSRIDRFDREDARCLGGRKRQRRRGGESEAATPALSWPLKAPEELSKTGRGASEILIGARSRYTSRDTPS